MRIKAQHNGVEPTHVEFVTKTIAVISSKNLSTLMSFTPEENESTNNKAETTTLFDENPLETK